MQYQVPQFIEVEDKIFGPFTFKQFIYLVGGVGISYVIYRFSPSLIVSAAPIIIVLALAAALAFARPNSRPFIDVMESALRYTFGAKLYLWKRTDKKAPAPGKREVATADKGAEQYAGVMVPKVSQSKLKDLAWNLDIQEKMRNGGNI